MKTQTKKRICLTLSESAIEYLNRKKLNTYTRGVSQTVEELIQEKIELELAE